MPFSLGDRKESFFIKNSQRLEWKWFEEYKKKGGGGKSEHCTAEEKRALHHVTKILG